MCSTGVLMSDLITRIRARIAALEAERAEHARQAQARDAQYAAAIGELRKLLDDDAPAE